ncbi:hypothetical protein ABF176_002418 [Flavobacterium psychrophilum]
MKLKLSLIMLVAAILTCCNGNNADPFEKVVFGKVSKKHFVNGMINENIFKVYFDNKEKPKDTTSIGYNFGDIPMNVNFNEEFISTKYDFGSLRKLIFTFGKDTVEYGRTWRASGSVSKKDVDKIYNKYVDFYGKPDSLMQVNEYKLFNNFFDAVKASENGYREKDIDKNYISGKKAMWKTENFILRFDIPTIKKNKKEKLFYQTKKDNSYIKITYEMLNYDKEFQKIQDSIASNLKPSDLVMISTGDCEWSKISDNFNDLRLEIKINNISRLDKDEPKRIKGVRFDLIIEDSFKEELFKSENLTIELPTDSYLESRPKKGAIGQLMDVDLNRTFWTEFKSRGNSKLVKLKNYSENNKINIICKIRSVLFEGGSVLKD